ncbi:MAG: membrane dipeptidase [Oscillospiraceae bacterium]|jgi:membrane dipeptidase|nr:membrane dipeptidase [Oscillospiraceae bacterium]MCI9550422.1 membrane dipeptidase [Oscillospiraceae bacterium]
MKPISVFDAHCDTISRCYYLHEGLRCNTGDLSLEKTERFARYCQFFALWTTKEYTDGDGCTMEEAYHTLLGCFRAQMACNSDKIIQCRTAQDVEQAHRCGKAAAFLTVEGAELLGCDPARLDQAAIDGVTAINLTWNYANALSGSSKEQPERGLSTVGRDFVRKMEDLHILVDVSHLSEAGFWDVAEIASRPFIASHSNAKSVWNHTRNLTNEQITAIIENQGVIGLNFYEGFVGGSRDLDMVRAHLDRILELGGAGNVALGGDWDGCDLIGDLPAIDSLPRLYEHLLLRGYEETVVQNLFYNNLMRVVR